jgi:adenosylhomocysteine nucleosidase
MREAGATSQPGIVVGLTSEARIARRLGWKVAVGGGTFPGAEAAARDLVAQGVSGLVSFGLAGGLDPALRPGRLIVPVAVHTGGHDYLADPALSKRLGGGTPHRLLGADRIAPTAEEKRRLWQSTGAAAIDLESGAVARIALDEGLPYAVLRAICDPAERDLPPAAMVALGQSGAIGMLRVLRSVLAYPGQVPGLLVLGRDAAAARRALIGRVAAVWPPPLPSSIGL